MLIAIPSKSRPYKSKSKELLKSAKLFVPENEVQAYEKIYPNDVIGVPLSVRGITATRNWILKQYDGEDVVFVDDDLKQAGFLDTTSIDDPYKKKHIRITEDELVRCFEQAFETVRSLGWKIWGAKTESAGISNYPEYPFRLRSYITAACMGIVNDGTLYFDETYKVKEDYEIGLRHVEMFGGVLSLRYFYWEEEHWTTDGGCKDYRNDDVEREAINKLIKRYPSFIRSVNRKNAVYNIQLMFD